MDLGRREQGEGGSVDFVHEMVRRGHSNARKSVGTLVAHVQNIIEKKFGIKAYSQRLLRVAVYLVASTRAI